jgi:hypothetical protein
MPQFGASLPDDSRVVIYDRNMFTVKATGLSFFVPDKTAPDKCFWLAQHECNTNLKNIAIIDIQANPPPPLISDDEKTFKNVA